MGHVHKIRKDIEKIEKISVFCVSLIENGYGWWYNMNEKIQMTSINERGDSMYTVYDIANWFLRYLENITNKKLQKLVYYAYAWYLVFNNESADNLEWRFFENKFEAWVHGAVYPELYTKYKKYGSGAIPLYEGSLPEFSEDDLDVLNQVLEVYGGFTGNELESICHQESPWKDARKGLSMYEPSHEIISDKAIFDCYSARL